MSEEDAPSSPDVVNQFLGRSTSHVPAMLATNDEIYKTLTNNQVRKWPGKIPSVKLTAKYALLNKIAVINWVPTSYTSEVTIGFAKFIYAIDIAGPSGKKSGDTLSKRQMIADLKETSKALEDKKLKIDRVIQALEAGVAEEGGMDGEDNAAAGEDVQVEDSDESASI
ncbi:envelope-like protein [Trifolium medium]|uniref:Envelope-like protein n=1 Tax=Trifolium medium TaxID=97028 RepID=A0A392MBH1_9FABA|nr:envelope-like protein [Trifolium medium]